MYSPFHGFWQSFVTIGLCNHLMRVISTYVGNTKKSESREDADYSNARIKYGVQKDSSYFWLVANSKTIYSPHLKALLFLLVKII